MKKKIIILQLTAIIFLSVSGSAHAKNSESGIDGTWRYTMKNPDNGIVTELKLVLTVKGSKLSGKFSYTPVARESLDASDSVLDKVKPLIDVYLDGFYKTDSGELGFDSGIDNSRLKVSVTYNRKTDTIAWKIKSKTGLQIPSAAELYRLDQKKWMDAGIAAFKKKDFRKAAECYYRSVAANEKNADAHYLLSTALAKMAVLTARPESEMQDRNFYTTYRAILELDSAIGLNKSAGVKAKKDDAWKGLSRRVHFLVVVNGYDWGNPDHMNEIIKTTGTFYKRSMGTAPETQLIFKKGGTFIIKDIMVETGAAKETAGLWRIEGDKVLIRIPGSDEKVLKFSLDQESGSIVLGEWFDHPDTSGGI